jgi:hypothetical protein
MRRNAATRGISGNQNRQTGGRVETPNLAMKLLRIRSLSREIAV